MRYLLAILILSFNLLTFAEPNYKKVEDNGEDKLEVSETKQVETKEVYTAIRITNILTGCEEAVTNAEEQLATAQDNLKKAQDLKTEAEKQGLKF